MDRPSYSELCELGNQTVTNIHWVRPLTRPEATAIHRLLVSAFLTVRQEAIRGVRESDISTT
jgi:hypothetical protein